MHSNWIFHRFTFHKLLVACPPQTPLPVCLRNWCAKYRYIHLGESGIADLQATLGIGLPSRYSAVPALWCRHPRRSIGRSSALSFEEGFTRRRLHANFCDRVSPVLCCVVCVIRFQLSPCVCFITLLSFFCHFLPSSDIMAALVLEPGPTLAADP